MCTHMHAHLGVRVKWMEGVHTPPNSLFRAANTQFATRESQLSAPTSIQEFESNVSNQMLPIEWANLNAKDNSPIIKC